MSGKLVEIPQRPEAHQDSLAERMARSPLSLVEALRCATEIAAALRDLHRQGLAYGAVSSQLIELGPSGATLRPTGVLQRMGDGRGDVAAFGAILDEMLLRAETAGGLDRLREEARALARRCRNESPAMQHVLIALRLLTFEARQCGAGARPAPRPAEVAPIPAVVAPAKSAVKPTATPPVTPAAKSAAKLAGTPVPAPVATDAATPVTVVTPPATAASVPAATPAAAPVTPVVTPPATAAPVPVVTSAAAPVTLVAAPPATPAPVLVVTPPASPVTPVVTPPATAAATAVAKPEATPATPVATPRARLRVRIRIALHWKPLASLAAACARAAGHAPSETVPGPKGAPAGSDSPPRHTIPASKT